MRKPSRAGAVRLRVSPVIAGAAAAGRLKVVGARYDLDEGAVSLLA